MTRIAAIFWAAFLFVGFPFVGFLFVGLLLAGALLTDARAADEEARSGPSWDFSHGDLKVADNGRFLVHADGTPFFYLGDTAWELFHRLDRQEAEGYLENRRAKGFTVIQAVCLAEYDGLHAPNAYGHTPLVEDDPARPLVKDGPRNDYWDHVDFIVETAREKGLYVGMLPTWGDKVTKAWGIGPVVFTPENAEAYGHFLGSRYKQSPNVVWILGGDRVADGKESIWRAMARGIARGDGGRHLATYHPQGGHSSAEWFHGDDWLDFNMLQSGHGAKDNPNDRMIGRDYARKPIKPCLDGEPRYEDHPVNWKPDDWFDDFDVRQAAYWALFAGAFGHTYGCHDIWQMYDEGRGRISHVRRPWHEALDLPGAWDMMHVRNLMLSRPFLQREPDSSLLVGDSGGGADHATSTRDRHGRYAFVYLPTGRDVTVDLTNISGEKVRAWWFDPRTGKATEVGVRQTTGGAATFDPPGKPARGNDWVLVLDDASQGFSAPGS